MRTKAAWSLLWLSIWKPSLMSVLLCKLFPEYKPCCCSCITGIARFPLLPFCQRHLELFVTWQNPVVGQYPYLNIIELAYFSRHPEQMYAKSQLTFITVFLQLFTTSCVWRELFWNYKIMHLHTLPFSFRICLRCAFSSQGTCAVWNLCDFHTCQLTYYSF